MQFPERNVTPYPVADPGGFCSRGGVGGLENPHYRNFDKILHWKHHFPVLEAPL